MPSSEADEEDFDDKSDLEEEERSLAQYSRREEQILHEGQQSIFTGEQVNINRSSMFGDDEHQLNKDEEDEEEPVVEDVVTHTSVCTTRTKRTTMREQALIGPVLPMMVHPI